jgi:dTDP-4-dehydrorhamnose 3,5-epimerase-like enzyme|tara:strand:- start:15 stop:437 length:423 start_codon:yes stop_codon:yes gene_type:complete
MDDEYKKKFLEADLINFKDKFEDNRGFIQPLCDLNMKSASLIYTKSNQWRANHYHKKDWHFIYVMSGEFEYYFRKTNTKDEIKKKIVKDGQLLFTGPMIDHAMLYTKETKILVVSKNPRDQKTYEEDTVRIDFMNDNNKF